MVATLHPALVLGLSLCSELLEVKPQALDWEVAKDQFEVRWLLPMRQLRAAADAAGPIDLERNLRELLEPGWPVESEGAPGCFGDVIQQWTSGQQTASSLDAILESTPLSPTEKEQLRQLLRDTALQDPDWNGESDAGDDAVLLADPWDFEVVKNPPWSNLEGRSKVYQGASFVRADVAAIKKAENDYRSHWDRPGHRYEDIHPVPGSYYRGQVVEHGTLTLQRLYFRVDLPFPFSDYECTLHILNRAETRTAGVADGPDTETLVCDVYSTSEDFYWLAGRDTFLPVRASDGTLVGTVIVKLFGFDLEGVPDGENDILSSLRSSLGFTKREAENLVAARVEPDLVPFDGQIPEFRFLGRKP